MTIGLLTAIGAAETYPDELHYAWWRKRSFFRQVPYRYFPPGIYGPLALALESAVA